MRPQGCKIEIVRTKHPAPSSGLCADTRKYRYISLHTHTCDVCVDEAYHLSCVCQGVFMTLAIAGGLITPAVCVGGSSS